MSKFFSLVFIFTLLTSSIVAATIESEQGVDKDTDTILEIVYSSKKSEQLQILNSYVEQYPTNLRLIEALDKKTAKYDNQLMQAVCKRKYVYYYTTIGNRDSIKHYIEQTNDHLQRFVDQDGLKDISDKDKDIFISSKLLVMTTRSTIYIDEGKYNLALMEIKKGVNDSILRESLRFKIQANVLTGVAHLHTKKPTEALANFNKAYEYEMELSLINESKQNNSELRKYRYYIPLEGAVIANTYLKKYDKSLFISDSLKTKLDEDYAKIKNIYGDNSNDDFLYNFFRNRLLCYSALSNVHLGNTKLARQKLDQVNAFTSNICKDGIHKDFEIYYRVEIEYYLKTGDYGKAKEYVALLKDISTKDKHTFSYFQANILLSKVLSAEGKNKEAYEMMTDLYHVNDSINAVNFSKEFAELEARSLLTDARLKIVESDLRWRNGLRVFYILGLALIVSITIAFIVWRNRKRLKEKNKILYKQYKEIESRNIEILKLQSINVTTEEVASDDNEYNRSPEEIILKNLDEYLTSSKVYLNSKISREEIASKIGTNRQYLIKAIRQLTNKTFNEYIYSYRIKYAYDLIVNNRDMTISNILDESGFNSRATFYNTFKSIYGMSPSELRNIIDENDGK